MPDATFPVATKEYHYTINGKRYRKVTFAEAQQYGEKIQAAYNDGKSLGWFVGLDAKPTPKPEAK